MSEIKVDTLTGKTSAGDITVTSEGGAATMQLQQGLAKAWLSYNHDGLSVRGSFNVASVTDVATGRFEPAYTNNMSDANYAAYGSSQHAGTLRLATGSDTYSTSATDYYVSYNNSGTDTAYDYPKVSATVSGDLA
jgi:hypothetical protein